MELIELGSILEMTKGKKPINTSDDYKEGYLPYVDIEAFENHIIKQYTDGTKCLPCEDGDILIVCDGSRSGLAGRAVKGYVGSTLAKLSAEGVSNDYLFHFIQGKYALLNTRKKGTGTPHLNPELLKKLKLIVPSLDEQGRIVARIEELFSELDEGVKNLYKIKEQLSVYREAVFKDAFSDINKFVPLGNICDRVFDGPFGSNLKTKDYVNEGIRVVRLENIKAGWFDDSKKSFVTEEKYDTISKHTVYPTDLIMSTFIADSVKACILPKDIGYAVNKADCVGIRLKKEFNQKYILFYLVSHLVYKDLIGQVHGATRPRVNTKQIKGIKIPVVDIEKQDCIVGEIEEKLSVYDNINQSIEMALLQADALKQSIIKEAFEGRL